MNWLQRTVASLVLLGASVFAMALDYGQLADALSKADSSKEVQAALRQFEVAERADPALRELAFTLQAKPLLSASDIEQIRQAVRLRELAIGADPATVAIQADKLQNLKDSPLYHDPGVQQQSNWFQESVSAFGEWVRSLFRMPEPTPSQYEAPNLGSLSNIITPIAWTVLAVAVIIALVFIGRSIYGQRKKAARKVSGLISDEEAKLTLDEWLAKADELARNGQFRDAVRCLYVASLLRLDEARALEFRRDETNWEHVDRYQRDPLAYDLRTATMRFDLVWYGNRDCSAEDVTSMRANYEELTSQLRGRRISA